MEYEEKKIIANEYLAEFNIDWDSLPDINSLHDAETHADIIDLCNARMEDDFGMDLTEEE